MVDKREPGAPPPPTKILTFLDASWFCCGTLIGVHWIFRLSSGDTAD